MNPVGLGRCRFGILWVLGFGYAHYRAAGKAKASETWPTAAGKMVACQVVVEESDDREGGTTTWYNPVVNYAYSVAGRELQGSRLRFGNVRSASRKKAEAALAPYPAGGTTQRPLQSGKAGGMRAREPQARPDLSAHGRDRHLRLRARRLSGGGRRLISARAAAGPAGSVRSR